MILWPFIVLAIILFLLFYPLVFRGDLSYSEDDWLGVVTLHPLCGLKWLKITLWDSANPKEKKTKEKKEKTKKQKKGKTETEEIEVKNKKIKFNGDTVLKALEIIKPVNEGVKGLRIRLNFTYSLADPAMMGYVAGPIYTFLPIVLGDMQKSRWRVRVFPDWEALKDAILLNFKATICIFDILHAFGGILLKVIKQVIEIKRRK
ncbi:MAG: hypothetical protein RR385_07540 [Clostridiales bacterium]